MPELPEVQTVRNFLYKELIGLSIIKVEVLYKNIIEGNIEDFIAGVANKKFTDITTHGKLLIFKVEDIYFTSHLRMEGKYFIKDSSEEILPHEHVIFYLSSGKTLRYHDVRKFGRIMLKNSNDVFTTPPYSNIGYEPFDERLTTLYLKENYNRNIPIKTLLLDQQVLSGLGNIYADEVLFKSLIHPMTKGSDLSLKDCENIIKNSILILSESIKSGGTTIRSYTSGDNVEGSYQNKLLVHTKEHEKCVNCSTLIQKMKIGGRSSYYCPNCQTPPLQK